MSDFIREDLDGYESMHENELKSRRFHHNQRSLSPLPSFELRPMVLTKKPLYTSSNAFKPIGPYNSTQHKCTCKHKTSNQTSNTCSKVPTLTYAHPIEKPINTHQVKTISTTHHINEQPINVVKKPGCCGNHHNHALSDTLKPVKLTNHVSSSSSSPNFLQSPSDNYHSDSIYYAEPTQAKIVYAQSQPSSYSPTPTKTIIKTMPNTNSIINYKPCSPNPHHSRILTIRPPPSPPCTRKVPKDTICQQTTTTTTTTKRTTTRSRSAGRSFSNQPACRYISKSFGDLTNISDFSEDSLNFNDIILAPSNRKKSKVNFAIKNHPDHYHHNHHHHRHHHLPNCKNNRISKSYLNLSNLDDSVENTSNDDCLKIVEKNIVNTVENKPKILPRTISIHQINETDGLNNDNGGVIKKITYVYDDDNISKCGDIDVKDRQITHVKHNTSHDSDISLAHCIIKNNSSLMPCNRSLHTGAIFNGYSFGLLTQHIQIKDSFYTSFSYRTSYTNGILMMIVDENTGNSFFIELVDSQLRATLYIDGEPDSCWTAMSSLTNDIWTNVKVQLIGSRLSLTVRHNFYTKNHRCKLKVPIHGDLFVAGYPAYLKPPPICRSKTFFIGEMKDFYVNYNGIKWYGVPTITNPRLRTWF